LGFLSPSGAPRDLPKRGFYINPSRRGPAVPGGGGLLTPRSGVAGVSPHRGDRGPPRYEAQPGSPGDYRPPGSFV